MSNLSTPPYKINPALSSINWKTEYKSKFMSIENNTLTLKIRTKIQIKKPFSQYKLCN